VTNSARLWARSNILWGVIFSIVLLGIVAEGVRQTHAKAIRNPNDFVTLYAGSICMTHDCNPYNIPQLDSVLVSRRGTEIQQAWFDQLPIYPPTTLVLLLPFSFLSYKAATVIWFVLSLGVYIVGVCWVCFWSPLLRGTPLLARGAFALLALHFPKMLQCLGFGNPSVMVTGLLLFAVFDARGERKLLRLIATLAACFLKPPMAIPVGMVMLLRESRSWREVWKIAALCLGAFVLVAACSYIPPGMARWPHDLGANLALGRQGGMSPINRVSPSNVLLNVANIPGYFTTSSLAIQAIAIGVVVPLTAMFVIAFYRMKDTGGWNDRAYLTAIATAAAITLLPVYHRFCDIGILLLVAPWIIRELFGTPRWQAFVTVPVMGALYFSWERRIRLERFHGSIHSVIEFLYYRGDALLVLFLACVLLSAMFQRAREPVSQ